MSIAVELTDRHRNELRVEVPLDATVGALRNAVNGALAREEHGHGSRRPERRRRAAADGFERLGGQLVEEHFREAPAVGRSPEALGVVLHVVREGLRDDVVLFNHVAARERACLLYTSPSPRDKRQSRMPSSA